MKALSWLWASSSVMAFPCCHNINHRRHPSQRSFPHSLSSMDYLSRLNESGPSEESTTERHATTFGDLHRIRMPGEDQDGVSSVGSVGVPTFAATTSKGQNENRFEEFLDSTIPTRSRGLEGAINQGPAFMLDNVLSKDTCERLIRDCENVGFVDFNSGKNNHSAMQVLVSSELAELVGQRLSRFVDVFQVEERRREMLEGCGMTVDQEDVRLVYAGLNRRWRIYRYDPDGEKTFAPHVDAGFPPSGLSQSGEELVWDASDPNGDLVVSRLTVLMYLNDDFVGGKTNFFEPHNRSPEQNIDFRGIRKIAAVRPVAGSCLVFPQAVGGDATQYARKFWPLHEGSPVVSGRPKYVIRSDILFAEQREP